MFCNHFISTAGLIDLPLEGYSFTWAIKSAKKMSKLDRFFNYLKGLLPDNFLLCQLFVLVWHSFDQPDPSLCAKLLMIMGHPLFVSINIGFTERVFDKLIRGFMELLHSRLSDLDKLFQIMALATRELVDDLECDVTLMRIMKAVWWIAGYPIVDSLTLSLFSYADGRSLHWQMDRANIPYHMGIESLMRKFYAGRPKHYWVFYFFNYVIFILGVKVGMSPSRRKAWDVIIDLFFVYKRVGAQKGITVADKRLMLSFVLLFREETPWRGVEEEQLSHLVELVGSISLSPFIDRWAWLYWIFLPLPPSEYEYEVLLSISLPPIS
ncbi:hypothetical protein Tco_0841371 [Tanacetum coccineum]|uniref:Maturase K n=1 Tax=Tanacetum coccineum TaxID=301880 RepID=A0ABQ5B1T8_9ASTR